MKLQYCFFFFVTKNTGSLSHFHYPNLCRGWYQLENISSRSCSRVRVEEAKLRGPAKCCCFWGPGGAGSETPGAAATATVSLALICFWLESLWGNFTDLNQRFGLVGSPSVRCHAFPARAAFPASLVALVCCAWPTPPSFNGRTGLGWC